MKIYLDIGSNHNQDLDRAKRIIKECGELKKEFGYVEGVKFQLFNPGKLWSPDYSHSPKVEDIERSVLPVKFIPDLIKTAKENDLEIGFTPFDFGSLEILKPFSKDIYYKISSFDLLRLDFIEKIVEQSDRKGSGWAIHVATGNSTEYDIENALEIIQEPILYACESNYPALVEEINLDRSLGMVSFHWNTGWSDHSKSIGVILQALSSGFGNAELHVDLDDKRGLETRHGHVWTIKELKTLLQIISDFNNCEYESPNRPPIDLRADPEDGLRPQKKYRSNING